MTDYQPLECDLHDVLEIACLHRALLQVELRDGSRFVARARTTESTADKEEFLLLDAPDGERRIRLDQLHAVATVGADGTAGARTVLGPGPADASGEAEQGF
ncbi:transcriptional antiterminator [Stenotrophomonas sp. ZAC14D1_NAIMI4_6]|uniref:Rho-binding antiterminator n=1 Tax=Stenotrophomonas maltophilia group TaxID=995085 RepID=UPI0009A21BD3|nr:MULTISPECIES: Rho-binding antiterminator [Stenotrophomonas maltophilia group]AWH37852.1 transcriptional antiterminator [Stenotrophomonas sp. ZAC14D1_NAIMI4_6]AWH41985.1 transcriptional antiterminator [Stenotrophomonas sp. ZAC14D1_NAIMI4_1]